MTVQRQIMFKLIALLVLGLLCAVFAPRASAQVAQNGQNAHNPPAGSEILAPVANPADGPVAVTPINIHANASNATNENMGEGVEILPIQDDYFNRDPEPVPEFSWANYFLVIGAMFLLLAVLWFVVWSLKKRNALPGANILARNAFKVEASLPLGSRRALILVRFMNGRYLLGVTDQQINLIKELADDESLPAPGVNQPQTDAPAGGFAALLKKASQKGDA